MENNSKRLLSLLVALTCLLLSLTGCQGHAEESQAPSSESVPTDYTLTFQTEGGMAMDDVLVKVFEDSSLTDLVYAAMTDREGKLSFTADGSKPYVAVIYPEKQGYVADNYYPITEKDTTVKVKTAPYFVTDASGLSLRLGDIIPDFHITCTDGTQLSVKDILAEKKAVVLNFWFIGCGPCRMEFPYLEQAYGAYKDRLEVIAINPYDGTDATVSAYAEQLGLTFPVASADRFWQSAMNLRAYPTTVVVDRYGMICLVHVGAVTNPEPFTKLFDFVTSDDYVQKTYQSIEEMNP